jgi:hypothetical protein
MPCTSINAPYPRVHNLPTQVDSHGLWPTHTVWIAIKLPQPQLRKPTYTHTLQRTLRATQVRCALSCKTGIYKRGHCSFFPTEDTGTFLPHSKKTSENNNNAILDYLPRRKRIFFSFQRCTIIYWTPARSKVMARRD